MKKANLCGENIKRRRKELGITQIEISASLEIEHNIKLDRSDISEIERGVRSVKDYELRAIAKILDVTLEWLLDGKK